MPPVVVNVSDAPVVAVNSCVTPTTPSLTSSTRPATLPAAVGAVLTLKKIRSSSVPANVPASILILPPFTSV